MTNADALARAQGSLLAFLGAMLERADVMKRAELAALLAVFAETTVETDPEQGQILAGWAQAVRQAAGIN
jgi:hypothetical protein